MATVEKIEKTGGIFSWDKFEVKLSCGHDFKTEKQPSVRVGDSYRCPVCG